MKLSKVKEESGWASETIMITIGKMLPDDLVEGTTIAIKGIMAATVDLAVATQEQFVIDYMEKQKYPSLEEAFKAYRS